MRFARSPAPALAAILLSTAGCPTPPPPLPPPPPRSEMPPERVVEIAAGAMHTCALRAGGSVDCWGNTRHGQLGVERVAQAWVPARVPGVDDAVQIAAGWGLTCVRRREGAVRCWGSVHKGRRHAPSDVAGIARAIDLVVGRDRVCAVLSDGGVACKMLDDDAPAARVAGIGGAKQVAAGARHTCALLADHTARCWGQNDLGQLGDGTRKSASRPARVVGLDDVVRIAATQDGTSWMGGTDGGNTVTALGTLGASGGARGLALGDGFACVVEADGKVRCAGKDDHGERAGGAASQANVIAGLDPVAEVATVDGLVCARLESGKVACWGAVAMVPGESDEMEQVREGEDAELAYGIPSVRSVRRKVRALAQRSPRLLPELEGASWLGRVGRELCAVRGGAALCWSRESALAAKPVAGLAGAVALADRCALLADGRVACREIAAEEAEGAPGAEPAEPTPVAGLSEVAQVAAAGGVTCARKTDGSVWCWGSNIFGGLGDGGYWAWHEEPVEAHL